MRLFVHVSLVVLLSGCLGGNKPHPENTSYDFGWGAPSTTLVTHVEIGQVTAIEAIDHKRIRYRLQYQNPSQVLAYSQYRWASSPTELLAAKLRSSLNLTHPGNCSIKIQIETFDHVFESPTNSAGVVKLYVTLYAKKARDTLASNVIQASATAPSQDAQGGVTALNAASTKAIGMLVEWANTAAAKADTCAVPGSNIGP